MNKINKKITAIIMILCLTMILPGCGAVKEVSQEIIVDQKVDDLLENLLDQGKETELPDYSLEDLKVVTEGFYCENLPEEKQDIYKAILHGLMNHEESFEVPADFVDGMEESEIQEEINVLFRGILRDHPELFWFEGDTRFVVYNKHMEFQPSYTMSEEDTEYYKGLIAEELDAAMKTISGKVEDPAYAVESDAYDYRIAKATFEYVIDQVEYESESEYNQVIVSSMVNKSSVCAGIARMCQYILQNYGMEAVLIDGNNFTEDEPHAWLLVQVDGEYYYMDPTFGNVDFKAGNLASNSHYDELNYNYGNLLMSEEVLHRDRMEEIVGEIELPPCTSDRFFYFKLTNGYFTEDSQESDWRDHFVSTIGSGWPYWEVQFEDSSDFKDCVDEIADGSFTQYLNEHADISHLSGCTTSYTQFDEGCQVVVWWAE